MSQVFIANLSYRATADDITDLVMRNVTARPTKVSIVTDKDNGRSKGFGFVEFSSDEGRDECIDRINGMEFMGRPIAARIAVDKPRGERKSGDGKGRHAQRRDDHDRY